MVRTRVVSPSSRRLQVPGPVLPGMPSEVDRYESSRRFLTDTFPFGALRGNYWGSANLGGITSNVVKKPHLSHQEVQLTGGGGISGGDIRGNTTRKGDQHRKNLKGARGGV